MSDPLWPVVSSPATNWTDTDFGSVPEWDDVSAPGFGEGGFGVQGFGE